MHWLHSWLGTNLTDEQLEELRSTTYDKWNWDTNDPADKALFEVLDEQAKQRKLNTSTLTFATLTGGPNVVITDDPGNDCITISVDEEAIAQRAAKITLGQIADFLKNDGKL